MARTNRASAVRSRLHYAAAPAKLWMTRKKFFALSNGVFCGTSISLHVAYLIHVQKEINCWRGVSGVWRESDYLRDVDVETD